VGHDTLLLPTTAAAVRDATGHVLLIRRGDGRSRSLPGSVIEPGEPIAACLVREVREETSLDIEPLRPVGIYSDPSHTGHHRARRHLSKRLTQAT
jgi:8-oxo-dGTP diphosphatase